jgi:hypothetical protein
MAVELTPSAVCVSARSGIACLLLLAFLQKPQCELPLRCVENMAFPVAGQLLQVYP